MESQTFTYDGLEQFIVRLKCIKMIFSINFNAVILQCL